MSRFKAADAEESVACNLIPMIDIMFLLLLFFMLSADMTTRVAEDMLLPVADQVKEDAKKGEKPNTTLNLVKDDRGGQWVIKEVGTAYTFESLKVRLQELAKMEPEPNLPPGQYFSEREIMLRAEGDCPYREVQRLIQLCSSVG